MKTIAKTMLALLALSASALLANAQDFGGPPPDSNQGPGSGPEGRGNRRPPPSVLMNALDTNHDGIIDSNEIANASAALKKLDKNGDGKLTPDELRPQRPQRPQHGTAQGQPPGPQGPPDGNSQDGPPHPDGQRPPPDGAPQGGPPQGGPPGN